MINDLCDYIYRELHNKGQSKSPAVQFPLNQSYNYIVLKAKISLIWMFHTHAHTLSTQQHR